MQKMAPKQVVDSQTLNDLPSEEEAESVTLKYPQSMHASPLEKSPPLVSKKRSSLANLERNIDIDFDSKQDFRHMDSISLMLQIKDVNNKIAKQSQSEVKGQRELLKEMVSKQKKRFTMDGFNLDLTYITPNIIAMGFPAENYESLYRNPMEEVQRFLNQRHSLNYKVFNLCSERKYNKNCFQQVSEYPFDDHQAPPFLMIGRFCQEMHAWLWQCEKNISAVHCKAGKGRTGVMICCYLLYSHQFDSAKDALKYYGMIRTQNAKGVTIPSQIRYVEYFSHAVRHNSMFRQPKTLEFLSAKLIGLPNFGILGGCDPFIRVQNRQHEIVSKVCEIKEDYCKFEFKNVLIEGDTLIQFFHSSIVSQQKMFQLWINTTFVNLFQIYSRNELDSVNKDKSHKIYPKNMELQLHFQIPIQMRRRSNCVSLQQFMVN